MEHQVEQRAQAIELTTACSTVQLPGKRSHHSSPKAVARTSGCPPLNATHVVDLGVKRVEDEQHTIHGERDVQLSWETKSP